MEQDINMFDKREKNDKVNFSGEITGEKIFVDGLGLGMPLRSGFGDDYKKKTKNENNMTSQRDDFTLYDQGVVKSPKFKPMDTYHQSMDDMFELSDNSMEVSSNNANAESYVSTYVNKFGLNILNLTLKSSKQQRFAVLCHGLYSLFGSLYMMSSESSKSDVYDFFGFPQRDSLHSGLVELNKIMKKKMININSMLLFDNSINTRDNVVSYISEVTPIHMLSSEHYKKEHKLLNEYIAKVTNNNVLPISEKSVQNVKIICLSFGYVNPLMNKFKYVDIDTFLDVFDGNKYDVNMMVNYNVECNYFEDSMNQCMEMQNNDIGFGIILPKNNELPSVSHSAYNSCVANYKKTLFDEIAVPMFSEKYKLRLTNFLSGVGLQDIFSELNISNMTKDNVYVSDVLLNLTVNVHNGCLKKNDNNYNPRILSSTKFLANHTFVYYLRIVSTNTLLVIGVY